MNIIKLRLLSSLLFCCMLMSMPLQAKAIFHGVIRNKYDYSVYFNSYNGNEALKKFPQKHYEYRLFAYNLRYDSSTPEHSRINKLNDFSGSIDASLDLLSSDAKRSIYKFKLTLKSNGLKYIGRDNPTMMEVGGTLFSINGASSESVKLADGSPAVFFIEKKLSYDKNGSPIFISLEKNKYFDLMLLGTYDPILTILRDVPVIITDTSV